MEYRVVWLDEVDSTNLEAKKLAAYGCPEWTVVAARRQTAGRGRLGRSWASTDGGLFFSIVLRPEEAFANPGLLTVSAGIAVAEAISKMSGIDTTLKWPNDVLNHGRKLSGLLAEQRLSGGLADFVVLGIGINVNTESFPCDLTSATSMFLERGVKYDINRVLDAVIHEFGPLYGNILTGERSEIINRYKSLCLNIGNAVILRKAADGREISGVAEDIGNDGSLVVRTTSGERISVNSGEVTLSPSVKS